ncbi:MBOAT family O-acyltransferase [Gehongia tenuis]|uniref:MBOAT family protein n=1 Tax=Gehongia tenuis TaxID=2763655 RepID=A0A926D2F9_9FIRM|nr:MBOAT family O-acyltransferase [Gehongia tenuis]MBC8530266.1 MBOAT family protein [Gehongia tenuis]
MLFNSVDFLIFFPIVTVIYFLIPHRIRYLWLLLCSYYFYMCWNPQYALLILFSTVITWLSGLLIQKANLKPERQAVRLKRLWVALSLILNLSILFFFKYYGFASQSLERLFSALHIQLSMPQFDILLPVGISFYTFQALSYTLDVYRKDIDPIQNFAKYALFVSFFPQLVAGPIERSKNLIPQFEEKHSFDYARTVSGLRLMLWGFFKKIAIADTAAVYVNAVFNDPLGGGGGLTLISAVLLFSVQIYCDFSGYSDIAIGSAKIMGFDLMANFRSPYFSQSITEFWNRWHISLSTWFRDYLYIPLGGNRKGFVRKNFNLMVVFLVSGLWHGASWHYVIWGALHGFYRIIEEIWRHIFKPIHFKTKLLNNAKRTAKVISTFGLVAFAWIFFRAANMTEAFTIIKGLFVDLSLTSWISKAGAIINQTLAPGNAISYFYYIALIIMILILWFVDYLDIRRKYSLDRISNCMAKPIRWFGYWALCILVLVFFIFQNGGYGSAVQFIYFQF